MEKLPKTVETQLVKDFLNEVLDTKLGEFETRLDKKFENQFGELSKKVDMVGALISNTHQEVKHFVELHQVLDGQVKELERRVDRLESLVEKLAH